MCRLNHKIFNTVIHRTVKSFCNIIDYYTITALHMINNNLTCKASSYRIVRKRIFYCFLNSPDRQTAIIVKTCTKADNH